MITLPDSKIKNEIVDFLRDLVIIVAVVLFITNFVGMNFQINGQSMYTSYYDREFIVVDRLSYRFSEPERGDVVVFTPHVHREKKYFLKRIIGLPGDQVKIEAGEVYVKPGGEGNYIQLNEAYLSENNNGKTNVNGSTGIHEYSVPEDSYFVMGDNRNHSTDSRTCFASCFSGVTDAFITSDDITGKVWMDLGFFSVKDFGFTHPTLRISTAPRFFDSPRIWNYPELGNDSTS
ncbi:signal peptidase I [Candidatus Gracilibacteria bacterium]|nr:signal peptidase I [Candidatus Gracilibacteria bacterium]